MSGNLVMLALNTSFFNKRHILLGIPQLVTGHYQMI